MGGKTQSQLALTTLTVLVIVLIGAGSLYGSFKLADFITGRETSDALCEDVGTQHKVVFRDDAVFPQHTSARLCDMMTITNEGPKDRLVSFGKHEKHIAYDGVKERLLMKGESLIVDLREAGEYLFHDHYQEEVGGTFSIQP